MQDGWKPSGHLSGVEWVLPLAAPPVATLSLASLSDPAGWERAPGQRTDANKCEEQSCGKVNNEQVNTHTFYSLHLKSHSCVWLFATPWTVQSMEFSRPEYWSGSFSLLQGIFPTQGSNLGLLHCRWILYQLSHKGSPRILEWVVYSFSRRSSQPRNQTWVSCIAGEFFTNWAMREAKNTHTVVPKGE